MRAGQLDNYTVTSQEQGDYISEEKEICFLSKEQTMKANERQVQKYELQNMEEIVSIGDATIKCSWAAPLEQSMPQHNAWGRLEVMNCICYLLLCNKLPKT